MNDNAVDAAKTLVKFASTRSNIKENTKDFVDTITREHLTQQQCTMNLLLEVVQAVANSRYVDGRNEAAVSLAKEIMKVVEGKLPLPYV